MKNYILLFFLLSLSGTFFAQVQNADSIFVVAQKFAESQDYVSAQEQIDIILALAPENTDYLLYKARLYAWDKDFEKAKAILNPLYKKDTSNLETSAVLIDVYLWNEEFKICTDQIDKHLALDPENKKLLLKKAICLEKLDENEKALMILDQLVDANPKDKDALYMQSLIYQKKKNQLSISYLNTSFFNPSSKSWHLTSMEFLHKYEKSILIGRLNLGNRNFQSDVQFEVDFYREFKNKSYLYLNYGIASNNGFFPKHRLGAEYYFKPTKRFDYSVGAKLLSFQTELITLITGHVAYKRNSISFSYRPYVDFQNAFYTHVVGFQKDKGYKEHYYRFEFHYGNVPYLLLFQNAQAMPTSYRLGFQMQHRIGKSLFIKPFVLYQLSVFNTANFGSQLNVQLTISKRF